MNLYIFWVSPRKMFSWGNSKKSNRFEIFVCCLPSCPRAMVRAMPSYELDNLARRRSPATRSHLNLMKALIPRLRKLAWHAPTSALNTRKLLSHGSHYTLHSVHTTHTTHCKVQKMHTLHCTSHTAHTMQQTWWVWCGTNNYAHTMHTLCSKVDVVRTTVQCT